MKRVAIILCLIGFFISNGEAGPKNNYRIAEAFLKKCKKNETIVSLGKFGWGEVEVYWSKVPELQKLRDDFEKADDELRDVLMQDEEYRLAREGLNAATGEDFEAKSKELRQTRLKVYRRLRRDSKPYRKAREKRDNALFISNIETLEYIINDYKKQGREFPVDWIRKQ